jgi:hypothetical protein
VHPGSAKVSDAISELQERYFAVDSLGDPESPNRPLDLKLLLVGLKGKILQIKLREGTFVYVMESAPKGKINLSPGSTVATVAASFHPVNVKIFDDFGELPPDTALNSFCNRFFVIQTDYLIPATVGLPNGKPWVGKVPANTEGRALVNFIMKDHPNQYSGLWSILAGNAILPDDQQLYSIVTRKKSLTLRLIPSDLHLQFTISGQLIEHKVSRSLRVSSLRSLFEKRLIFQDDWYEFWCGKSQLNDRTLLGSVLWIETRGIQVKCRGEPRLRCFFLDAITNRPIEPSSLRVSATVGDLLFYFTASSPSALEFYSDKERTHLLFKGTDSDVLLKNVITDTSPIYVLILAEDREVQLILPPDDQVKAIKISSSETIGDLLKHAEPILREDTKCESGF